MGTVGSPGQMNCRYFVQIPNAGHLIGKSQKKRKGKSGAINKTNKTMKNKVKHNEGCKVTKAKYRMAGEFIKGKIYMPIVECDCLLTSNKEK